MPEMKSGPNSHTNTTFCNGKNLFYVTKDEMEDCVWKAIFANKKRLVRYSGRSKWIPGRNILQHQTASILDLYIWKLFVENETFNGTYYIPWWAKTELYCRNRYWIGHNIDVSSLFGTGKQGIQIVKRNFTITTWNFRSIRVSNERIQQNSVVAVAICQFIASSDCRYIFNYIYRGRPEEFTGFGTNMEEIGHRFKILDQCGDMDEISRLETSITEC